MSEIAVALVGLYRTLGGNSIEDGGRDRNEWPFRPCPTLPCKALLQAFDLVVFRRERECFRTGIQDTDVREADLQGIGSRGLGRFAVCLLLVICSGCEQQRALESFGGPTMGNHYSVVYAHDVTTPDRAHLQAEVETVLAEVDQQMSTWRLDSEISRFNLLPANSCQYMPSAVLELVDVGRQLSQASNGAFDLTVEPLMELWGFGAHASKTQQVPSAPQLTRARGQIGYRNLRIDGQRLCKDAAVQVDLNSLAAGHTVDRIARFLDAAGVHDYMVQAMGEMRVKGRKPDGAPWRVKLEAPRDDRETAQKIFQLDDYSVSTSGDYRDHFEHGRHARSRTFDALTGLPVSHALASVTVLHPSAMMADGLSSMLLILGPERGWNYAQEHQIAAFFVIRADKRFIIHSNASFDRLVTEQPL